MEFTGERYLIQSDNYSEDLMQHLQRYIVAKGLCENKIVLDIACGEGYGSDILADAADYVYGVDISEDAVKYASDTYKRDNLTFMTGSVCNIPMESNSADIIVSFETIEHVSEEEQEKFLKEIKRVLKQDGVLIISSPDKKYYSDYKNFKNKFHIKELYQDEFESILKQNFIYVDLYYQGMIANSYVIKDKRKPITEIKNFTTIKDCQEYYAEINIAICSDYKSYQIENNYIADYANKYYALKSVAYSLQSSLKEPAYIIEQKENYIQEQRENIHKLEAQSRELNGIIEQKENYIQEQRENIHKLEAQSRELNGIIEQNKCHIHKLERFVNIKMINIVYKMYEQVLKWKRKGMY